MFEDFGLSHVKLQMFTEALRKVKTPGLEFLFKRNILTQDQFVKLHGGKSLKRSEIVKIILKGFPRYDLLYNLYKIVNGVRKFNRLFEDYPNTPKLYPDWINKFHLIMDNIRS